MRRTSLPSHLDDKLRQFPNIRDYQSIDLHLKDGRILEAVAIIDGHVQDSRVYEFLPEVIDVSPNQAWLDTLQPPTPEPLKWRE